MFYRPQQPHDPRHRPPGGGHGGGHGGGQFSNRDRQDLREFIDEERRLARHYSQAAQRTQNRQLTQLWRGYSAEAQRRADTQQNILRGGNQPGGWHPGGGWHGHRGW